MASHPPVSQTIAAANERLIALRQQRMAGKESRSLMSARCETAVTPSTIRQPLSIPSLPTHLGWESDSFTKHIAQQISSPNERVQPLASTFDKEAKTDRFSSLTPERKSKTKDRTAVHSAHIRHYPTLGIAALQSEQAALYRVWLACRVLDSDGSGRLDLATIRSHLTDSDSALRLFGWRRLRQMLHQGNGRFWQWNQQQKRLWLYGAARLSSILKVNKLVGSPVLLPIKTLTNGIGTFKAHLYAAFHSGRQVENPISRETQSMLTGVPQRTQRHYEKEAKVRVQSNYAVGEVYSPHNLEKHIWRKGGAVFQFVDKQGRMGKRNGRYIAWQLPNSYSGPHQKASWGNQRKINQQLIDLVHKGAQGNGEQVECRYFQHGAAAAKAISKKESVETYWPLQKRKSKQQLWSAFF